MNRSVERLDPYGDRSEASWVGRHGAANGWSGSTSRGPAAAHDQPILEEERMALHLAEERRTELMRRLEGFYLEEFDETLSAFRSEQLLNFVLETVAPHVYNQAVQDARVFMQRKLDELDGEVAAPWAP